MHQDVTSADKDPQCSSTEPVAMPVPSASAPEREQEERGEEGSLTDSEKISVVLTAFDMDGDGRLNFREANELQRAAWGGRVSRQSFARVCADVGADARRGLGPAELRELYARFGTLERDFLLSLKRLQGGSPRRGAKGTAPRSAPCRGPGSLLPLLALPVAVSCPLLGMPLMGVLVANGCRQRAA